MDKQKVPQGYSPADESAGLAHALRDDDQRGDITLQASELNYGNRSAAGQFELRHSNDPAKSQSQKETRSGAPSPYRRSYANIETLIAPSMKVLGK